jgi:uncharacterized protein (DUF1800 family)
MSDTPTGPEPTTVIDLTALEPGPHRPRRSVRAAESLASQGLSSPGPDRRTLLAGGAAAALAAAGTGALLLRGAPTGDGPTVPVAASGPTGAAGTAALTAAAPATAAARPAARRGFALPRTLDPALLISRTTYGRTPTLERQVEKAGATRWLAAQLRPASVPDPVGTAVRRRFPRLDWSQARVRAGLKNGDWAVMQDVVANHLGQAAWSSRQLREVMVDLWSNHLNVTCPSSDVWDTRHRYDIDVIRRHALGSFEQMLVAAAFHPSMLVYLNNAESTGQSPNENYARELLELHTVGVDGGYTERDVRRSALLLTGWTVTDGKVGFDSARHHSGPLKVMTFSTSNRPGRAKQSQVAYLRHLARHPRTARAISHKLATRFVSDDPPAALVNRLATVYRRGRTEIVPVLRALFASPEFAASAGEKVRRPMEHVAASVRTLGITPGTDPQGLTELVNQLGGMGHAPLGWPQPNGYGDVAADWQSPASALAMFNATGSLVHGWWPTRLGHLGPDELLPNTPDSRAAVIDAVGRKVLGRKPSAAERTAARTLLAGTQLPTTFSDGSYQQKETVALTATLFLASPAHRLR